MFVPSVTGSISHGMEKILSPLALVLIRQYRLSNVLYIQVCNCFL